MKRKIFASIMALTVASLLVCTAALCMVFYNRLSAMVLDDLRQRTITLKDIAPDGGAGYAGLKVADMRMTVVSANGAVLYDDDESLDSMDNHAHREEIEEALATGVGESIRFSETLGMETYYYAVRLKNGDILRLSKTTGNILSMLMDNVPVILMIMAGVMLSGYWFAGRLTESIVKPINEIDPASAETVPYDELVPFARTIQKQREQIDIQFEELKNRADTLAAIMDNMREGIALIDRRGTILSANKSALAIFEFAGSVHGRNVVELLRDTELNAHIREALRGRYSESVYEHAGRVFQVFFSPAVSRGALILLLDVTERMGAEKIRRAFSANVSHELKTPLSSIGAYAEMIVSGMAKESDVIGFVKRIKDESARLMILIEDIIMLSELDEKAGLSETEPVDLVEIAMKVSGALSLKASEAQVGIHVAEGRATISGNRSMLYDLMYNLVDNGIKYNKPGGMVSISVSVSDGLTILSVSDTGIGIKKEHLHRVFERFYRVDKSRSKKTGGTGLGLSIVKHIASIHGGTAEIHSVEGKGTTVTIAL